MRIDSASDATQGSLGSWKGYACCSKRDDERWAGMGMHNYSWCAICVDGFPCTWSHDDEWMNFLFCACTLMVNISLKLWTEHELVFLRPCPRITSIIYVTSCSCMKVIRSHYPFDYFILCILLIVKWLYVIRRPKKKRVLNKHLVLNCL